MWPPPVSVTETIFKEHIPVLSEHVKIKSCKASSSRAANYDRNYNHDDLTRLLVNCGEKVSEWINNSSINNFFFSTGFKLIGKKNVKNTKKNECNTVIIVLSRLFSFHNC